MGGVRPPLSRPSFFNMHGCARLHLRARLGSAVLTQSQFSFIYILFHEAYGHSDGHSDGHPYEFPPFFSRYFYPRTRLKDTARQLINYVKFLTWCNQGGGQEAESRVYMVYAVPCTLRNILRSPCTVRFMLPAYPPLFGLFFGRSNI